MTSHTVILLGGNSKSNKTWVDGMRENLRSGFNIVVHEYSHWENAGHDIDFNVELARLKKLIKHNNIKSYSIVAKSAGLLLSLIGVQSKILSPVSIVGFGLPLEYAQYREIVPTLIMADIPRRCRVLFVQGTRDPQGSADRVRQVIPENILLAQIRSDNHAYDNFKKMSQYARTFMTIHRLEKQRLFLKAHGASLREAVSGVYGSQHKYRLHSTWMYDPHGHIRALEYGDIKYIAKRTSPSKSARERNNAEEAFRRLGGVLIGNRALVAVVPSALRVAHDKVGYLVSEYKGAVCNEQFYTQCDDNILSANEVKLIAETLADKGIAYPGFLPRNTIVTDGTIYLIDWEDAKFSDGSVLLDESTKTNYLIGWSLIQNAPSALDQSNIFKKSNSTPPAGEYEKVFSKMIGAEPDNIGNLETMTYMNAILGESCTKEDGASGRLKRDDIVCAISPFIPIEVEVFIDTLLARDIEMRSDTLHWKLSDIVRLAIIDSHLGVSAATYNRRLLKALCGTIKNYLEINNISIPEAITDIYTDSNPNKGVIGRIAQFLELELIKT